MRGISLVAVLLCGAFNQASAREAARADPCHGQPCSGRSDPNPGGETGHPAFFQAFEKIKCIAKLPDVMRR